MNNEKKPKINILKIFLYICAGLTILFSAGMVLNGCRPLGDIPWWYSIILSIGMIFIGIKIGDR